MKYRLGKKRKFERKDKKYEEDRVTYSVESTIEVIEKNKKASLVSKPRISLGDVDFKEMGKNEEIKPLKIKKLL